MAQVSRWVRDTEEFIKRKLSIVMQFWNQCLLWWSKLVLVCYWSSSISESHGIITHVTMEREDEQEKKLYLLYSKNVFHHKYEYWNVASTLCVVCGHLLHHLMLYCDWLRPPQIWSNFSQDCLVLSIMYERGFSCCDRFHCSHWTLTDRSLFNGRDGNKVPGFVKSEPYLKLSLTKQEEFLPNLLCFRDRFPLCYCPFTAVQHCKPFDESQSEAEASS